MKKLILILGVIMLLLMSCCQKKSAVVADSKNDSIDKELVTFDNEKQLLAQVAVLKQFDSMSSIIVKQGKIIDSISKAKVSIQYVDKIVYKEKLSSKYNDKQIDSIIQSNVNLRNIIKHQNIMKK